MRLPNLRQRIASLPPEQRAAFEQRLLAAHAASSGEASIPRRDRSASWPASPAQQRLWFLEQLEPNNVAYNLAAALHLRGFLLVSALRRALDASIARHEVLRTTFSAPEGHPVQVIGESRPVDLPVIDLEASPTVERQGQLDHLLRDEARRPFDLARDLLLRATLFRLAEEEHVLLLGMHHIASDGWSMGVFLQELGALYTAFSRGDACPLPPLSIQYADYAVWQQGRLQGPELEAQLAYWRRQLAGAPAALDLPTDRPRPAVQTYRGARQAFALPRRLGEELRALGRREGATLFMILLAAFQALLSRYTGQEDISVGSPIAGRTRLEVEPLIGFFVNTLVLRADLSGSPTFRELLGRVRETSLQAYAHQDVPFEKLVEVLQPGRDLSRNPLVQVMFAQQSTPLALPALPGLTVTPLEVDSGTAKFDLTLSLRDTEEDLRGTLEYSTDLFDVGTIRRLLGHFQTLLEGIVTDPEARLVSLPLLPDGGRRQLLVEWNDTRAEYPREACLHQLFEAQVERTPEAVALISGDRRLIYRELNRRANRVAHHLRRLGVGPEVMVGLAVERSPEMVVGALGILKAGGAYVPLDPTYPRDRLAFILGDARPRVLLTQRRLAAGLPPHGIDTLCLDAEEDLLSDEPEANPDQGAAPDGLAYVIYTSGSTGRPKGVLAPHRGAVNRLAWMWRAFPFAPTEVCCQKTSLNFVDSIWEIFGPLLQGIPTLIITDEVLADPRRLVPALAAHHVTRIVLVPSLLHVLLETYGDLGRRLPDLRLWVSSGEVLPKELVGKFYASLPDGVLLNLYGSSEAAADSTWHDTRAGCSHHAVPIGRPISNTQIYLLDGHGQPVPIGVPGELYIGGDGLARGYLHRPELTAERFVPHPFTDVPGARLYRTGDLARYLPAGTLEFLGRRDHQVKLRGYRIELGEIEAVLGRHPAVREAVVVAREDAPGEVRLVAYVVPAAQPGPTAGELLGHAKERLPAYMVPAAFVQLEALPLTPNGKVDRQALPAPDGKGTEPPAGFVPPRDMLELQLAKIWEKVLGLGPVGVRDNFFDLGGHSLLAVRLFAEMTAQFGHPLPLATIFQAPTVEGLGRVLRQAGGAPEWSALVPIQPGGIRPPLFCVHQHTGHLFCYRDLARHLGPDQPVYGLAARGLDAVQAPWSRIEEMAAHYVREVRALQPQGPYYLAGYCFGGAVAYEMAQQLRRGGQAVALLALIEASWAGHAHPLRRAVRRIRRRIAFERAQMGPLTVPEQFRYLVRKATLATREQGAALLERVAARRPGARREMSPVERAIRRVENAHLAAIRNYVPDVYPGWLALFRHARPSARRHGDPTWGWGALATGGIDVHEIPGSRPTIVDEPDVRILAERLAKCLEAAGAAREKP